MCKYAISAICISRICNVFMLIFQLLHLYSVLVHIHLDDSDAVAQRKSIGGDHRDEYRFLGACFPDEGLPSVADAVVLFFCNLDGIYIFKCSSKCHNNVIFLLILINTDAKISFFFENA